MQIRVFGDPFLAGRTMRACGGRWIDLAHPDFELEDTLLIQAGTLIRPFNPWKVSDALIAVGATLEEEAWTRHLQAPKDHPQPQPKSIFLSAVALRRLQRALRRQPFFAALQSVAARRWVEPQLRNWFYPNLRVLQVITSLQVGGAERVCLELSRMAECIGTVTLGVGRRATLAAPNWDLSKIPVQRRISTLLELAQKLHVDLLHTHLLTAAQNAELERFIPVITTIHNTSEGWPLGYTRQRPGFIVGCSKLVTHQLGASARTAWNGISPLPCKTRKSGTSRQIRLIAVANFRPQKKLHRIPIILAALRRRGINAHATIVGQVAVGDHTSEKALSRFQREVRKHRLGKHVSVLTTTKVASVLASHDVFVSVSEHEGLSMSQLEALSAGLPVVATTVGGSAEIAASVSEGGYQALSPRTSTNGFADAIIAAASQPRTPRLPERFTARAMQRRYGWLYRVALSCNGPGLPDRTPESREHFRLSKRSRRNELWLIINNFSMGGAQSSARRLLEAWKKDQPVRAFTLQEVQPSKTTLALRAHGVPVENLAGTTASLRCIELLRIIAAGGSPQGILLWNVMALEKCLLADALDTPLVDVSPGEMYFSSLQQYFARPLPELPLLSEREYGQRLAATVVKYGRERSVMRRRLGRTPEVIPNGVTAIKAYSRTFKRKRIFGTAARISPQKRLEDLIDVFSALDIPLLIAGRIEPGAEEYAAELRRRSTANIRWAGERDANEFLRELDVFVMISEPAGCPNASLEALASGLPIIATDVGGANEQVLTGKNGWLVPPRDAAALKRAVLEAWQASPRELIRLSRGALQHSRKFSMTRMVACYQAFFRSGRD